MSDVQWQPDLPWMKNTGDNQDEIVSAFDAWYVGQTEQNSGGASHIVKNDEYSGSSLSLNQVYPDGQVGHDRWRIPVGFWFNTNTGEVRNDEGIPQDWDTLVSMG